MNPAAKTIFVAIFFVAALFLVGWNFRRLKRFRTDYRFTGFFPGTTYECVVGGLDTEHGTLCMVGADTSGIYLLSHPKPRGLLWLLESRHRVLKQNLLLPWDDLNYRTGKMLLKDCLWLEMPSRRIYLHVPKDSGAQILKDGGRDPLVWR